MPVCPAAAYGAFIGLCVGDAAGAVLEFYQGTISRQVASHAMLMPGGGALRVGPGQVTDDSELAMSLACALQGRDPARGFPLDTVASAYVAWYLSRPFDSGLTCGRAFGSTPAGAGAAARMMQHAVSNSIVSEANGSLMRVLPLALWSARLPIDVVAHNARLDAMLSHPSPTCQDCNVLYCIAIAHLVTHPGDAGGAIDAVEHHIEWRHTCSKVVGWYGHSRLEDCVEQLDCRHNIGHVRHAFTLAMHFLRRRTPYAEAILRTLMKGGDTDTNAAIVGGMMGALHGPSGIPPAMLDPVLAFRCDQVDERDRAAGHRRPATYSASAVRGYATHLLDPAGYAGDDGGKGGDGDDGDDGAGGCANSPGVTVVKCGRREASLASS
jgi:ADP-ribosyl-[dinitrogen reductase] hydrolase